MGAGSITPRTRKLVTAVPLAASFAAAGLGALPIASKALAGSITVVAKPNAEYVLIAAPPSVRIFTRSSTVTASGDAPVGLVCPAGAPGPCRGALGIGLATGRTRRGAAGAAPCRRHCRSLGRATYAVRPGARLWVRVHLNPYARRLLRRHRALRVDATATTAWGARTVTTARMIIVRAGAARPGRARSGRSH